MLKPVYATQSKSVESTQGTHLKNTSRLLPFALIVASLAGCAGSSRSQRPVAEEISPAFRSCASESKTTWLVNVVLEDKGNKKSMATLVADFVGGSSADQLRAMGYLNDLQRKKYSSGEHMGATQFDNCMAQKSLQIFAPGRSLSCYREQRIIFALEGLRFDQDAPQEQAAQHLMKANPSADGSNERMIQRLAKDVYTILKPGGESSFGQAQFDVCMTKP
jgi:hypothetical protein